MGEQDKKGQMQPAMQSSAADASAITRKYNDGILIEERLLDSVEADISAEIFGEKFSSPIMMPAFCHLNGRAPEGRKPMEEYAEAAKELNIVNWVGMEENDHFEEIAAVGARTVRVVKPFADHDKIFRQLKFAEEHGAIAVGMDIDHIFGRDGSYDVVIGEQMGPVSFEELSEYIASVEIPFVVKGVLSAADALKCREAGAAAILVSTHHGRMPFAVPPLAILPSIMEALGENRSMQVFVDSGIDDGRDAFKALAMGADAVAVGRAMLPGLMSSGKQGVIDKVQQMNAELKELMNFTCIGNLSEMDPTVLWVN